MKPRRALIIHPNNDYNCGDQLTFLGAKSLLSKALGGSQNLDVLQFDILRCERESDTYISQYHWGQVDLIVLAGSPWLWNCCEGSIKYKWLIDALARYPEAKVVGLGVGSCFGKNTYQNIRYEKIDNYFFNAPERQIALKKIYDRFNYVLVRDAFAKYILNRCDIQCKYSYDTSIFSYNKIGIGKSVGNKKVLFFYNPLKGLSKNALDFDGEEYNKYQMQWARENNADIFVNDGIEADYLKRHGLESSFSVDLDFMRNKFTEYDAMLSGRVHMAVLGFLAGIQNITLMPVDTRYMTALKFGINLKFIGSEFNSDAVDIASDVWSDIKKQEDIIVKELRNAIM